MDGDTSNVRVYKTSKLRNFLTTRDYADCFFIMDNGEKVQAHKLLLACCSPVFEKMFYGPLASSDIKVNDVDVGDFKQMLEFVYTDNVTISCIENAWNLYSIANRYLLDDLTTCCVGYIERNLSLGTLVLSYELSQQYNEKSLSKTCWTDMIFYTQGVILYDSKYHMQFSTFCRLLEETIALCDSDKLTAIVKWTINECSDEGSEVSQQDVLNTIKELNLVKYLSKIKCDVSVYNNNTTFENSVIKTCIDNLLEDAKDNCTDVDNKGRLYQERVSRLCKERQLYKIASRITLGKNEKVVSLFQTNREIVLFGLLINTERKPSTVNNYKYNGSITVTIASTDNEHDPIAQGVCDTKIPYDLAVYIEFNKLVVISADRTYTIGVSYSNSDRHSSSVLLHYFGHQMCNQKNKSVFTFFEACGSVVKAFCYYPV